MGFAASAQADGPPATREAPPSHSVYVVRPGDTLWEIASRLAGPGDPRPIVDEIAARNRLDATLVPGETLVLP